VKEVKIIIDKNGKITIDFNGFVGDDCFKEREKLQKLLRKYGLEIDIEHEERKPEAYIEGGEVISVW